MLSKQRINTNGKFFSFRLPLFKRGVARPVKVERPFLAAVVVLSKALNELTTDRRKSFAKVDWNFLEHQIELLLESIDEISTQR